MSTQMETDVAESVATVHASENEPATTSSESAQDAVFPAEHYHQPPMEESPNGEANSTHEQASTTESTTAQGDVGNGNGNETPINISIVPTAVTDAEAGKTTKLKIKVKHHRDEVTKLTLSPDLSKSGKRQRKLNTLFSGFAIDKKTSHVLGKEEGGSQDASASTPTSDQQPTSISVPLPPSPSPSPSTSAPTTPKSPSLFKKEMILSPVEIQAINKKLPKGYVYVPTVVKKQEELDSLPQKRERKRAPLSDYVSPIVPEKSENGEVPKVETPTPIKERKKPGPKPKKHLQSPGVAVPVPISPVEEQKFPVSHPISPTTPIGRPKREPGTEDVRMKDLDEDDDYALEEEFDDFDDKKRKKTKKQKRGSVYDKFDSDEEPPAKKLKTYTGKKPGPKPKPTENSSVVRTPRNKLKSNSSMDEEGESEEVLDNEADNSDTQEVQPTAQQIGLLLQSHKLVLGMRKHKQGFWFNEPVDPVKLNLPDYFTIIKKPMDFGTIAEKFDNGDYRNIEEFAADMRLIFTNALTYNVKGIPVYIAAQTLSREFEKKFTALKAGKPIRAPAVAVPTASPKVVGSPVPILQPVAVPIPVPMVAPPSPPAPIFPNPLAESTKAELTSTINVIKDSMIKVREEIARIRKEKTASSPAMHPPAPKGRPPVNKKEKRERDLTFDEKKALSDAINTLQPENLGKVIHIVHSHNPHLAQNAGDETEIEIDFDSLDTTTLRALERFVKSCQKKKPATPSVSKLAAAELASKNTSESIQSVKNKLKELNSKTGHISHTTRKKNKSKKSAEDEDVDILDDAPHKEYPSIVIEKSDSGSSSDSSSSESSSDTDSENSSENEAKKKQAADSTVKASTTAASNSTSLSATSPPTTSTEQKEEKPEQESKDNALPEVSKTSSPPTATSLPPSESLEKNNTGSESPQIIMPAVSANKDISLQNLSSWTNLTEISSQLKPTSVTTDDTWSKFQSKEQQKKLREKEREEQEEKERREKVEREMERKKQEESRLKEAQELEEKRKREEEEVILQRQRDLAAKRAAEKAAREQESRNVNMLEQHVAMSSFETAFDQHDNAASTFLGFKLKDEKEEKADKEDGEL